MAALEPGWGELAAGCPLRAGSAAGLGRVGAPRPPQPHGAGGLAGAAPADGTGPARALRGGPRASPCGRRKHRMDGQPDGGPASKKRLTEAAAAGPGPGTPAVGRWLLGAGPPPGSGPARPCLRSPPGGAPGVLESPCEEMEQAAAAAGEQQRQQQQREAARRKLREIEDRITDEDEEGLAEGPLGHLPTLVLSDTLKTGLKRDYAGDLTKKIIESMSRPSMELVVWKPLPEFLTKKAKPVSIKKYKPVAERCPAKPATLEAAFNLQTGKFPELQQAEMPSAFYSTTEPAGCSEEEMEL